MAGTKKLFSYTGAVKKFNVVVANNWHGTTYAVSAKQAKANLAYQYKRVNGLIPATKVEICGTPVEVA